MHVLVNRGHEKVILILQAHLAAVRETEDIDLIVTGFWLDGEDRLVRGAHE